MDKEGGDEKPSEMIILDRLEEELQATRITDRQELKRTLGLSIDNQDMPLTPEVANRYRSTVKSLRHGLHAAVPLYCLGGKDCPIGHRCPFTEQNEGGKPDYENSSYPLNKGCPIERDMVKLHIADMLDEYEINPEDTTDIALISRIAVLDVYEYRANIFLGKGAQNLLTKEVCFAEPKTGVAYYSWKVHPAFEILERIHKMRQDLLKAMIATRREKAKVAATGDATSKTGLAKAMAVISAKLKQAEEEERREAEEVIDVEFEDV